MGIRNPTIRNPESFEIRTFWRSDLEWVNHSKTGHKCPDFECFSFFRHLWYKLWFKPFENRTFMSSFWMFKTFLDICGPNCGSNHSKTGHFVWTFFRMVSGFQMAFHNRPTLDHLKTGHVRFLDPHCTWLVFGSHWIIYFNFKRIILIYAIVLWLVNNNKDLTSK